MHFAHPFLLLLLIVPVLVGWWEWRRHGVRIRLPFDHTEPAPRPWLARVVNIANMVTLAMVAAAILLLAGPQRALTGQAKQEMRNIQFLLDVSNSMTSPYGKATRYDGAMEAINKFTTYRKGDSFGLSVFGNEVINWVPMTKDTSAIRLATPFLQPNLMPSYMGGTAIGKGLMTVKDLLAAHNKGERLIILLTDGQSQDLGAQRDVEVAKALSDERITVYSIFIGDNESTADIETISRLTNGETFKASDPRALSETFQHIDSMEKAKYTPLGRSYVDWFFPVVAIALVCVGLQTAAGFGLRYTPW